MSCVSLLIVKKGDVELEGLTDQNRPRRLGPKRANKIRKMFTLPKHSDNANKKEKDLTKVQVDHWDVTRYVVRRQTKEVDGKAYFKV
jgi:hypothetical protein